MRYYSEESHCCRNVKVAGHPGGLLVGLECFYRHIDMTDVLFRFCPFAHPTSTQSPSPDQNSIIEEKSSGRSEDFSPHYYSWLTINSTESNVYKVIHIRTILEWLSIATDTVTPHTPAGPKKQNRSTCFSCITLLAHNISNTCKVCLVHFIIGHARSYIVWMRVFFVVYNHLDDIQRTPCLCWLDNRREVLRTNL